MLRSSHYGGGAETETLGALLRRWRMTADLSVSQVAVRAGIAKSSVSVWENGIHQPRIPELTAVLHALGVGPRETHLALSSIHAPRAVAGQAGMVQSAVEGAELTPTPGRLLRTLRERRGVSLRRLARSLGKSPTELVRWETKGTPPPAAALTALLKYLEPEEAEARWLQERFSRLAPPGSRDAATLDSLEAWLWALKASWSQPNHLSVDLEFLLWEMQVYGWLVARREAALELLRDGRCNYGMWLTWEGRLAEGNQYAASVIRLGQLSPLNLSSDWLTGAAHIRAAYEARSPQRKRPTFAVRLLHGWLGASDSPRHQSPILREISQFSLEANEAEYALKASERALQVAYKTESIYFIRLARFQRIEIATRVGLHAEALSLLNAEPWPNEAPAFARIQHSFRWVDLLTAMGDGLGADDFLRQVYADMERYNYQSLALFERAESAAQSIEGLSRRSIKGGRS